MISVARRSGVFASVLALAAVTVVAQSALAAEQASQSGVQAQAAVKMSDTTSPDVIHRFPPTVKMSGQTDPDVIHRFPPTVIHRFP